MLDFKFPSSLTAVYINVYCVDSIIMLLEVDEFLLDPRKP